MKVIYNNNDIGCVYADEQFKIYHAEGWTRVSHFSVAVQLIIVVKRIVFGGTNSY